MSRIRIHREGQPLQHSHPILPMEDEQPLTPRQIVVFLALAAIAIVIMAVGSAVVS